MLWKHNQKLNKNIPPWTEGMMHTTWECWGSRMQHNTPVSRHYIHQKLGVAEKSVMNLSAGLVSAAQCRAPSQIQRLSLRTAQGHGLCSEHHDRCGNYLIWWRKKKSFSIPGVSQRLGLCGQNVIWSIWFQGGCEGLWAFRNFPFSLCSPVTIPPITPPIPWSASGFQQKRRKMVGGERRAGGQINYVVSPLGQYRSVRWGTKIWKKRRSCWYWNKKSRHTSYCFYYTLLVKFNCVGLSFFGSGPGFCFSVTLPNSWQ